jgi:hypothetical protein
VSRFKFAYLYASTSPHLICFIFLD